MVVYLIDCIFGESITINTQQGIGYGLLDNSGVDNSGNSQL